MSRKIPIAWFAAALAGVVLLAGCSADAGSDSGATASTPTKSPTQTAEEPAVQVAEYNLGNQAFEFPGYDGKNELSGVVHYPADLAGGRHPLIVVQHGIHPTCADRQASGRYEAAFAKRDAAIKAGNDAESDRQQAIIGTSAAALYRWPCAKGVKPIRSDRGYDYLAERLAEEGFVVVSVGANGINATTDGQSDRVYPARAALLNRHLDLWRQLVAAGSGPLKGALKDRTGAAVDADFRGRVDLTKVGAVGHSMGGRGVVELIADGTHSLWPAGVKVKAGLLLAPAQSLEEASVTHVPLAVVWGTCDATVSSYFEIGAREAKVPVNRLVLTGGTHSALNSVWSRSSGQVGAYNDATPGKRPGTCRSAEFRSKEQPKLMDEQTERAITAEYAVAYFEARLRGDAAAGRILAGQQPIPGAAKGLAAVESGGPKR